MPVKHTEVAHLRLVPVITGGMTQDAHEGVRLAPARCVTMSECRSPDDARLVGRDLAGIVRIEIVMAADDVSTWWIKTIRSWLAAEYNAVAPVELIH